MCGLVWRRLQRARYRGSLDGGATQLVIVGSVLLIVMSVIAFVAVSMARAAMPDYDQQAAQMVGRNVQEQIAAAVYYDPTMQAQIDAKGVQRWTQAVTVKGVAQNATITTTPNGPVLLIDVTVGNEDYRTFAPLSATSIAPGTVVHGG